MTSATAQVPAQQDRPRGGWPAQPKRPRKNRKLIELRVLAGLSPNTLAAKAGIAGQSARNAEAGYRVSNFIQRSIADALGVTTLDIWPLEEHL